MLYFAVFFAKLEYDPCFMSKRGGTLGVNTLGTGPLVSGVAGSKSIVSVHRAFSNSLPFVRGYSVKSTSLYGRLANRIILTQPSESI